MWLSALPVVPERVEETAGDATIFIEVADSVVFLGNECTSLRWQMEGIRSVRVGNTPSIGEGELPLCSNGITIDVGFVDDTNRIYRLERFSVLGSTFNRALFVIASGGLVASYLLSPLPRQIRTSLEALLPSEWRRRLNSLSRGNVSRFDLLILIVLILWGYALRVAHLSQPLRLDEAWTYRDFVSQPLSVGLSNYYTTNNHVFHTLLAHFTTTIFGGYPWALRLPAFFAGVLLIPAVYIAGRRFFSVSAGLLAAALVASSMHLIEYSTNARGYTLIALALLLLLIVADYWLDRSTWRRSVAFVVLTVLGFYAVPTFIYGFIPVVAWMVTMIFYRRVGKEQWRTLRSLISMCVCTACLTLLLYIPPLMHFIRLGSDNSAMEHLGAHSIYDVFAGMTYIWGEAWGRWNTNLPLWLAVLLVFGFVFATVWQSLWSRHLPLFLFLLLAPAMIFVMASETYLRLWMFYLPVYLVIASGGVAYFFRILSPALEAHRLIVGGGTVAVSLLIGVNVLMSQSVYKTADTGVLSDSEPALLLADEYAEPGDLIVCDGNCEAVEIYAAIHGIELAPGYPDIVLPAQSLFVILSTYQDHVGLSIDIALDLMMPGERDHLDIQQLLESDNAHVYQLTLKN
jgi:hypothetical protein